MDRDPFLDDLARGRFDAPAKSRPQTTAIERPRFDYWKGLIVVGGIFGVAMILEHVADTTRSVKDITRG